MNKICASLLKEKLGGLTEVALIDVRAEGAFAESHLLFAVSVPLDRLELSFAGLVPRQNTPVVLCDDGSGRAEIAAERLTGFGYTSIEILDGGVAGWDDAGYELFSGVNVPSKAFGEFIEHEYGTPHLPAEELKAKIEAGDDIVVLDSRPAQEFLRMNIPGAICCPGAELVYRLPDIVAHPETLVVVNCAGRTRSIIGSQSLINAGVPNRVVALKNGTMGWHLAGYALEHGKSRLAPEVSARGLEQSKVFVEQVKKRFSVPSIDMGQLQRFREQSMERSLFLLDVRSEDEFQAGHLPGSKSAPGGQLVQATDEYVGVRNARLVLIDDTEVRSTMTASWLIQMGWPEVYVLAGGIPKEGLEAGSVPAPVLGLDALGVVEITASSLRDMLADETVTVLDLADSLTFREGHVPGARRISRLNLSDALQRVVPGTSVVMTSPDGMLAQFAGAEFAMLDDSFQIFALRDGTAGWRSAGYSLEEGADSWAGESPGDVWYRPYERTDAIEEAMQAYLDWEVDLVAQIERDGTARFRRFDPT